MPQPAQLGRHENAASLSEQAYQLIRDRILRGELPLGAVLSRRKLAGEFGMSFLPVSEALQRLENEELVESRPRVGTRVRIPSADEVLDRYILREAVESQSARRLASCIRGSRQSGGRRSRVGAEPRPALVGSAAPPALGRVPDR